MTTPSIWGDTYNRAVARGDDHGYAAYLADRAQERAERKAKRMSKLDIRAHECLRAAMYALDTADDDKTFGEIRAALRRIYGEDAFKRAAELARPE